MICTEHLKYKKTLKYTLKLRNPVQKHQNIFPSQRRFKNINVQTKCGIVGRRYQDFSANIATGLLSLVAC